MSFDLDQDLYIPGSFPLDTLRDVPSEPPVATDENESSRFQDMDQPTIDSAKRSRMSSLFNIFIHQTGCTHKEEGETDVAGEVQTRNVITPGERGTQFACVVSYDRKEHHTDDGQRSRHTMTRCSFEQ